MTQVRRGLVVLGLIFSTVGGAQTTAAAPLASTQFADDAAIVAIQQAIQQSADEQTQAMLTRNYSLMSDTMTSDYLQSMGNTLDDMFIKDKVNNIALVHLDWGGVTVSADGSSANATTFEVWHIDSQAGSIDFAPERNDYTLVLDSGAWKVKADNQTLAPDVYATTTAVPTPTITPTPTQTGTPTATPTSTSTSTSTPVPTDTPTPAPAAASSSGG